MVTVTVSYATAPAIDRIVVIEDEGTNIQRYVLEYQDPGGAWHAVAKNDPGQDLVFPHRSFDVRRRAPRKPLRKPPGPAHAKRIRLHILDASAPPRLVAIAAADLGGRRDLPLWWRRGLAEALVPKGPVLDPGPRMPIDRVVVPTVVMKGRTPM